MFKIPVFFRPDQVVDSRSYSPSAGKAARVVESFSNMPVDVLGFSAATAEDLKSVHCSGYVNGVLSGKIENGFKNKIDEVNQACLLHVGSFVAAADHVAEHGGVACSPTSGFHHAAYDSGAGYCTFNGLMVAANRLADRGFTVGILDCDAHYGDGTQDIIDRKELAGKVTQWSYGAEVQCFEWDDFSHGVREYIELLAMKANPVLFYQAGADPHRNDPLGPGEVAGMTTFELAARDRFVFQLCDRLGIPVVWNLAGGYQRDAFGNCKKVISIHRSTMVECVKVACGAEKKRASAFKG